MKKLDDLRVAHTLSHTLTLEHPSVIHFLCQPRSMRMFLGVLAHGETVTCEVQQLLSFSLLDTTFITFSYLAHVLKK